MSKIISFPSKKLETIEENVIKLTTSIKCDLINLAEKRNQLLKIQKELRKLQTRTRLKVVENEPEPEPRK